MEPAPFWCTSKTQRATALANAVAHRGGEVSGICASAMNLVPVYRAWKASPPYRGGGKNVIEPICLEAAQAFPPPFFLWGEKMEGVDNVHGMPTDARA